MYNSKHTDSIISF